MLGLELSVLKPDKKITKEAPNFLFIYCRTPKAQLFMWPPDARPAVEDKFVGHSFLSNDRAAFTLGFLNMFGMYIWKTPNIQIQTKRNCTESKA